MSDESTPKQFSVGDRVRLAVRPPYIKTADTMPMLRPPDVLPLGETGIITEARLADTWKVKFNRGSFLLDAKYIELADQSTPTSASSTNEEE